MIQYELHRHLDGCFRASTISELSIERKLTPSYATEAQVKREFCFQKPIGSLTEFIRRFDYFQNFLTQTTDFERMSYEAAVDAAKERLTHIEFRYSPSFAGGKAPHVTWEEGLQAIQRGFQRAKKEVSIQVGLIGIVTREYDTKLTEKSADFFIQNKNQFVGVDLAGDEVKVPASHFKTIFQRMRDSGLKITVHAGEASGPESIWQAIDELGARRIGHGVAAIKDRALLNRLQRDEILIEVCPWSNFITQAVTNPAEHPLPRFLSAGIACTLCTDDPGILGKTMSQEVEFTRQSMGLSDQDFNFMNVCARQHTFISK